MHSLVRRLEQGGVVSCDGVDSSGQAFLVVLLRQLYPNRPLLVIADGLKSQETLHQDVSTWLKVRAQYGSNHLPQVAPAPAQGHGEPLFFPAWEVMPHEGRLPHLDVISERLETLVTLLRQHRPADHQFESGIAAPIIVTSIPAVLQRTFPRDLLEQQLRTLKRGERVQPLDLVEWLEDHGYEPEAQVTQQGELSLRGGILDVYPLTSPWPVRLEFFGDELESLRYFDPLTQISREETDVMVLPPAGELGLLKQAKQGNPAALEDQGRGPAQTNLGSVLDFLPKGTILFLCEPEVLAQRAEAYAASIPAGDRFHVGWEALLEDASRRSMAVLRVAESSSISDTAEPSSTFDLGSPPFLQSLDAFRPMADRPPEPQVAEIQRREFFAQLHRWLRQNYAVHVFCNNDGESQRFTEIWKEYGFGTAPVAEAETDAREVNGSSSGQQPAESQLRIQVGSLSRGFIFEQARMVVVTDAEIFGRYKVQRPRRLRSARAQTTRSALDIDFTDLEEGDYVVHLQHGIGKYVGLRVLPFGAGTKPTEGASALPSGQECLVIEYAPHDPAQPPPKLYVPVSEAHLVSKYVGTGKARPPLNTLGGTRWAKAKAQAERAVRDVASDLLAIQAARESQAGHAFAADVPWQREFESAFLFEETPDQLRAIQETKADMERPKPMDRLICGDVGFGKTEVGIRAAFKAVMDGRQVAVLVPTTVLAQQHYNTFRERMADYPVRIELLSRFRTRRAQQRVVRELAAGSVDIVIGTHRLLQSDITFKDLGLVVIDEEQRFGVLHKEKFKMLRRLVDVLTLSATPIPRTLYLALTGARDMSTIQTPPHDRLPVETLVVQYDERVIRDAIQRELNRGGQVFFLHNRVATIEAVAHKLRALVPQARIVVGHGQMHSDDLEEVMTQFVNGEAEILLSTTIIESGLDIPNANTIIIDRADRFGLSDLYQLRGRVGRYKHQAYAYLLLPRHAGLLADVRKRLSAIKQYSTLGSGFKIAMRDLEIRGAGNLLGAQQSGHITAVGFELYCQLLKQSVSALKGEKTKPRVEVQVRLDFLALSPVQEGPQAQIPTGSHGQPSLAQSGQASSDEINQAVTSAAASKNALKSPSAWPDFASIPFSYISDSRQRIDVYRKIAQVTDKASISGLERELRDRFGPLPRPMELLLQVAELKVLAADRGITTIEVKEGKVMLTRNHDYVMVGTKFPRLTKTDAHGRLKEIRKLLLAL